MAVPVDGTGTASVAPVMAPLVETLQETLATIQKNVSEKMNVFKIECCGCSGQLPTERMIQ